MELVKRQTYYGVLFIIILNFLALLGILTSIGAERFVMQIFTILVFLIIASIALYLLASDAEAAWPFTLLFFSLNLMNAVYLFLYEASLMLVIYAVAGVAGFIMSIYGLDRGAREDLRTIFAKRSRIRELEEPPKEERPTMQNLKQEIIEYLERHDIDYKESMTKQELLDQID